MKEYKLSAKSKYSVLYLLCGLFMFFFMFAIFNLSSFATSLQSSALSLAPNESFSETYGILSYNYNINDYDIPVTTITTTSSGSGWSRGVSSSLARGSNTIHLVTSEGDFVVNVSQGTADGSNTNHTVTVAGVPQRVYAEFEAYNDTSSAKSVYAVARIDSISVSDFNGGSGGYGNIYSSFVPVSLVDDVVLYGKQYYSGDACIFDFGNTSSLHTYPTMPVFLRGNISSYCLIVEYDAGESVVINGSQGSLTFYKYAYNGSSGAVNVPTSDWVHYYIGGSNHHTYICFFDLDSFEPNRLCNFYFLNCVANGTMQNCKVQLLQYSATIGDYMNYVQSQWDNISPSVTDTNTNISQSVSDISTAQTFETSAFDNFNTQFSSSGLDTFSMSFASTPLLWVSSIITTFYNNMPATFQYLLMFVAFVGILCTVLNVFGRVAQRFGGGDNATKLNSKDVFSKIEKNGSI